MNRDMLERHNTADLDQIPLREADKQVGLPSPGPLATQTLARLKASFARNHHRPSSRMWAAIADIVAALEAMADCAAEPLVHLASLDPGVGKTQSVVQFLPVLLESELHADVGVIVCANRRTQIEDLIHDAKRAGLRDDDFAVYTADPKLNKLGRGADDRHNARCLFTTHSMVLKRCREGRRFADADDFHFKKQPREVRVWDEAITPGLAISLSQFDLTALIKPVSLHNGALAARMLELLANLLSRKDGEAVVVPDLASDCGVDLSDLEAIFDDAPADQKIASTAFWHLCGKTATVRHDGKPGNALLDYREALPSDLAPLLVLDASSRRDVRETYNLWAEGRGGIKRLLEAPKDYAPATFHHWGVSGGKTAFRDTNTRKRLMRGVAAAINTKPTEKWLVVHHKDKGKENFEEELRSLLSPAADVSFLHWGAHDASNAYADRSNVVLAGTLFLRPSQYEAIGRAAAGRPSASGSFPKEAYEAVRRGEHRNLVLQAVCRGRIRKCDGASCPPTNVYVVASRASHIGDDLPTIFPGCRVVRWEPVKRKLTGKVGMAVAFLMERARDGSFVPDADVMKHVGATDKSYYNRRIKKHDDLRDGLAEHGIAPCQDGRTTGFRRLASTHFGNIAEHE